MHAKLTLQRITTIDAPLAGEPGTFVERMTFAGTFKVAVHYADNEPFRIMVISLARPETFEADDNNMSAYRAWVQGNEI